MAGRPAIGGPGNSGVRFENQAQGFSWSDVLELVGEGPDFEIADLTTFGVALIDPFDAIKANAVAAAADKRDVFRVRPAKRHRRAGWSAAFHAAIRQILIIPDLLGDHAAAVGDVDFRMIGIGRGDGIGRIGGCDAQIVARLSFHQIAAGGGHPVLDVRGNPVGMN